MFGRARCECRARPPTRLARVESIRGELYDVLVLSAGNPSRQQPAQWEKGLRLQVVGLRRRLIETGGTCRL